MNKIFTLKKFAAAFLVMGFLLVGNGVKGQVIIEGFEESAWIVGATAGAQTITVSNTTSSTSGTTTGTATYAWQMSRATVTSSAATNSLIGLKSGTKSWGGTSTGGYLITPALSGNYVLTFSAIRNASSAAIGVYAGSASTLGSTVANYNTRFGLYSNIGTNTAGLGLTTFSFTAPSSAGMVYGLMTTSGSDTYIDEITLTPIASTSLPIGGFNFSAQTGGASNYGASPVTASLNVANTTITGLTRGAGVTQSGTGAARGLGGNGFNAVSAAAGITANAFFTFTVKANSSYNLNLSSLSSMDYRTSSTGPTSIAIQYSLDGSNFTTATTKTLRVSGGPTVGGTQMEGGALDLSGISALQNVPSTTTITFRFVPFGASASGGNFYFFDFLNNVGEDLTINGSAVLASAPVEPTNYPTATAAAISATSNSQGSIALTWTDATGANLPTNYIIRGSSTSYAAITAPTDGAAVADNSSNTAPDKNIAYGAQTATITGLSANTTYYFQLYPYQGTGATADYKTSTVPSGAQATTTTAANTVATQPFRSLATGNWSAIGTWQSSPDGGTSWVTASSAPNNASASVLIRNGHTVTIDQDAATSTLTVGEGTSGALIYENSATPRTVTVATDVTVLAGGSFTTGTLSSTVTHVLSIGGNLIVNGTGSSFDMSSASSSRIVQTFFTSAATDVSISGTTNNTIKFSKFSPNLGSSSLKITSLATNVSVSGTSGTLFNPIQGILEIASGSTFTNTIGQSLTFPTGTSLSVTGGSFVSSSTQLTVAGSLSMSSGSISLTAGNLVINGSASISGGACAITNSENSLLYGPGASFTMTGGTLDIAGCFRAASVNNAITFNMSAGTITAPTSASSATTGTFDIPNTGSSFTMSGGTIILKKPSTGVTVDYRNYAVTTNITGGTVQFGDASTAASSTFLVGGSSTTGVTPNTVHSFPNLTINATNAPSLTLTGAGTGISITGTLTNNGGTLTGSSKAISLTGNWSNSGTFTPGTQTVTFNGTGAQSITKTGGETFSSVTINKASGTATLGSNVTVASSGTFDVTAGTLDVSTFQVNPTAGTTTTFNLGSGAKIITANTNGLSTTGSINTVARTFSSAADYEFQGANTGTFTTTPTGSTINNLIINRSGGITLSQPLSVAGTATLTSGILTLGSNDLTITSTNAIANANNSSRFVVAGGGGKLVHAFSSGTYTFPIGASSSQYAGVDITNTGGGSQTYTVGVVTPTTYLSSVDAAKFDWSIATGGGTQASTLAFTWSDADANTNLAANASGALTYQNDVLAAGSSVVTGTPNIITVAGITNFTNTRWNVALSATAPILSVPVSGAGSLASFGSVRVNQTAGPGSPSFTITGNNLTTADVTVGALTGFTYSTTSGGTYTSSLTLSQPGGAYSQDIYVKFSPTAIQSYSGNIVVGGGGASNINVAAVGNGIGDNTSTVSATGGYSYPSNFDYSTYTAANTLTTGNSLGVAGFTINDLGSGDNLNTKLTAITFTVPANTGNAIKAAALFDGSTNIAELSSVSGTSIAFTGLTLTASDNATKNFELRVTFENTVTDNHQMTFTVSSATADAATGSTFAAADGGAATTSTSGDNNRIKVTASQLVYTTPPPTTATVSTNLTTTPIVAAQDANGNVDVDFAYTGLSITNSGSLSMANVPTASNASNGVLTFTSNFQFTSSGTVSLSVAATGVSTATSSSIVVSYAIVSLGTYPFNGTACAAGTLTATSVASNLTFSSASVTGETCNSNSATSYSVGGTSWSTAFSSTRYVEFTVTPTAGYIFTPTSLTFDYLRTAAGATNASVRSSADGYTSDLTTLSVGTGSANANISLSGGSYTDLGSALTFRIYGWGGNSTGDFRLDNITLNGYVIANTNPYLSASVSSLSFSSTGVGLNSTSQTFNLSGGNLTGAPSNITATAPSTDFQVSADNATFGATALIPYSSATLGSTAVYVRFSPQSQGSKSGNITFSGGGVTTYSPVIAVSGTSAAAVYYSKSTGNLNTLSNWGTNTDGSGIAPSDFTSNAQTFTVVNQSSATIGAAWTVSGTSSKVVVGDGTNTITLTIPSSFTLTGTVDVTNHGTLKIQHTTSPTFGTFATGSTVNYAGTSQTITASSYKNLDLTGASSLTFPSGTVNIAEIFTPASITSATQGTISFNGTVVQTIPSFGFNILNINNGAGTSLSVATGSETGTCVINAGSTVTVGSSASSLTRTAGNLLVMGTINNTSTTAGVYATSNAQLGFGSTGVYNYNGGGAATNAYLPAATWNTTSTATVTGVGAMTSNGITAPTPGTAGGASAKYGNVTIDNPNLSGGSNAFKYFGSNWTAPVNIGGNLTLGRTGTATAPLQTTTGSPTITIDGNLNIYAGNYGLMTYAGTSTWNISGNVVVDATYSFGSSTGYTDPTLTITGTGATAANLNVKGNITVTSGSNAGTAASQTASIVRTAGTSTLTLNGTSTQTVTGVTGTGTSGTINVVVNKTTGNVSLGSTYNINGTLTLTSGNLDVNGYNLSLGGTASATSNIIANGTNSTVTAAGITTIPSGLFASNAVTNLTISSAATLSQAISVSGNLTLSSGAFTNGSNLTMANGSSIIRTGGTLGTAPTIGGGNSINVTYNTNGSAITTGNELPTSSTALNGLTISNSTGVNLNAAATVNGTLTLTSGSFAVGANTLTLNGGAIAGTATNLSTGTSSNLVMGGSSSGTSIPSSVASLSTLTINNSTSAVTMNGSIALGSSGLTVTGILDAGSNQLTGSGGTWTINGTLKTSNANGLTGSGTVPSATLTFGSSSTVDYNGSGTQIISAVNYNHLTSSNSGNRTLASSGTIGIAGTFTQGANTYTNTGSTIDFNKSTGGQTIPAFNYNNLTVSNSSGTNTLSGTIGIAGTFTPGSNASAGTSTIDFNGSTQNIPAFTYNNLTASGAATKTMTGAVTVSSALKLSAAGDKLSIGSNTLTLNGSIDGTGNGFITGSSTSNISIGGSGSFGLLMMDQSSTDVTNQLNNLTMNRTGVTATLGNALRLAGVLTPTDGVIASAGNLTLASPAPPAQTARIAERPSGGSGYITGDVTVERYITGLSNRAYRLLTSSVNTSTSINANWQEGKVNTTISSNVAADKAGYGTHITGTAGNAAGFDETQFNSNSLFTYNTTGPSWDAVTSTLTGAAATMDAKTGYLLFVRGNRDNLNTLTTALGNSDTRLRARGSLPQGTQTFSSLPGLETFSLVTNPYASPIFWKATAGGVYTGNNATNFSNSIAIWDPNVGSRGGFVSITSDGDVGGATTNLTNEIQSGQAFFVQTQSGAGPYDFVLEESYKSSSNNLDVFRTGTQTEMLKTFLFYTNGTGRHSADGVTSLFKNGYSTAVDGNDAKQIGNWDEDVCIGRDGKSLSIEKRPLADVNDTIPLKVARLKVQAYEWEFQPSNFNAPGMQAYLVDSYLGTETAISLSSTTVIPFTVTSNTATSAASRFSIVFQPITITHWTGTSSTDFTNAANWDNGLPSITKNAVVPHVSNMPVLSSPQTINSIALDVTADISLAANLTIKGDFVNNGHIKGTGTVLFNGTRSQTITGKGSINNLSINNTNGVSIETGAANMQEITGILTLMDGALNTNDNLTLKSSSIANTATIAAIDGTTNKGSINGKVVVERYIPAGKRGFRFLAPGVSSTTSIKANWQEAAISATDDPKPGYGTHITGSIIDQVNGFDASITGNPSLFLFDNATQLWSNGIANTDNTNLIAGNAYRLMVRGNRSYNLTGAQLPTTTATILRATGNLLTGQVKLKANAIGATANMPLLAGNADEYSFVGNPYVAALDWSQISKTDITGYYYIWDPTLGTRGAYVSCFTDGTKSNASSAVTKDIQPGQAFFVQNNSSITTGPELTIEETHKSSGFTTVFRNESAPASINMQLFVAGNVNGISQDGAVALFNNSYSNAVNNDDATKMLNLDENIAIARSNRQMSIERRAMPSLNDTVHIKLWQLANKDYVLKLDANDFNDPSLTAYIQDSYLNNETVVGLQGITQVAFTANSAIASSIAPNRFRIVFRAAGALPVSITSIKAYQKNQGIQVDWTTQQEINMQAYEVEKSTDGVQFKHMATVNALGNAGLNSYNWLDANPVNGSNYYRIKSIEKSGKQLYSQVVKVNMGKAGISINAYPNPMVGNSFNLELNNLSKGPYTILVTNKLGQELFRKLIDHTGGPSTQTITIDQLLAIGTYQLMVVGKETSLLIPLIKQ
jgi:hypothetical protein